MITQTPENKMRERICQMAKSIYDRGLTHGSTGNISARLENGQLLVTPTGSSFGFLDPSDITLMDLDRTVVRGRKPTKELPLHLAFYDQRNAPAGAVVHLHSHHAVALSLRDDLDPDNMLPPLTPYGIIQLGHVRLLPYFRPGDPAMAKAVADLDPRISAVVLANHGPVVASDTLERAVFAIEELEATARLALESHRGSQRQLTPAEVGALAATFDLDFP